MNARPIVPPKEGIYTGVDLHKQTTKEAEFQQDAAE
jgi:hypothetical protein